MTSLIGWAQAQNQPCNLGQNQQFFVLYDIKILWETF